MKRRSALQPFNVQTPTSTWAVRFKYPTNIVALYSTNWVELQVGTGLGRHYTWSVILDMPHMMRRGQQGGRSVIKSSLMVFPIAT